MAQDNGDDTVIARMRRKYPRLDHVARAGEAYSERYGNHYAAAITYFSVLSLFPLLMVGFSIASMILAGNESALNQLRDGIVNSAPSGLGDFLRTIVETALTAGAGTGIVGLVLGLYSGIGWMTNLRDALTAQWGQEKKKLPLLSSTLKDFAALVGLALAMAISFGLSAAGSGIGRMLLRAVGLDHASWAVFVLRVVTIVLSLAASMLVFVWVISRLPRERVTARSAVKGAIIAAIGFEVLKQATTVYLSLTASSPSTVLFGPIIGLLFFANLVSRFVLFVTAWTAVAKENQTPVVPVPNATIIRPQVQVRRGPGIAGTVGVFGVGALIGWLGRRRR